MDRGNTKQYDSVLDSRLDTRKYFLVIHLFISICGHKEE